MSTEEKIDWFEEGRKQFVASKINPTHRPLHYPTQDIYTPKDESDYCSGYRSAEAAWRRGEGFSGMDAYADEIDEQRREAEKAKANGVA